MVRRSSLGYERRAQVEQAGGEVSSVGRDMRASIEGPSWVLTAAYARVVSSRNGTIRVSSLLNSDPDVRPVVGTIRSGVRVNTSFTLADQVTRR